MISLVHRNAPFFKIGYLPLTDSAPLLVAQAKGFFAEHEVNVSLTSELGWATIREKMIYGELDGAAAVAGFAAALRLGWNAPSCSVIAPLVLSLQGNAITLSKNLYQAGVRDAASLCQMVRSHQNRVLTFGVISRWSSHYFLLRDWLASGGLRVDRDVRLVILPPALMPRLLSTGVIDGFCAGEPWNSVSVQNGEGWVAATTGELSPQHVEKVLLLNEASATRDSATTARLLDAIRAACVWCDEPENRPEVAEILFQSGAFSTTRDALRASLVGPYADGTGRERATEDFHVFHRHDANTPSPERALWLMRGLRRHGVVGAAQETALRDALVASWGVLGGVRAKSEATSTTPKSKSKAKGSAKAKA